VGARTLVFQVVERNLNFDSRLHRHLWLVEFELCFLAGVSHGGIDDILIHNSLAFSGLPVVARHWDFLLKLDRIITEHALW